MAKINIIYGEKGSGKTKKMVDSANRSVEEAKGVVVYIDKDNSRIHDLEHTIKLIDASEYKVDSERPLSLFSKACLQATTTSKRCLWTAWRESCART